MLDVLGPDYAIKAAPELLMHKQNERHPTERADLFGKRLVVDSETEEGRRLAESLLKDLTGGDRQRARRMKENFWEFNPTHKIILATNYRPVVRGTDEGIWRRLRLIPFAVCFWDPDDPANCEAGLPPELRQDKHLREKLKGELPGILTWCVRGCLEWQREGLGMPTEVKEATAAFREEQDALGTFLLERCLQAKVHRVRARHLYACYSCWCKDGGEVPLPQGRFGQALSDRGFERYTSNGTWYRGLALRQLDGDGANGRSGTQ
jgi:putative DNA primase/helicase